MGKRFLAAAAVALGALGAFAQGITLPPSGGNQRQTVIQQVGPVKVSVEYSSPHVHSPQGDDRKGKIWGALVPYGLTDLGFGTCKQCPWRGGANENTVFTTSHDIVVNGQKLPAGSYALFYIVDPNEWTAIFSKNHTSWGSFFYDPAEDALRVKVKPEKSEYREVLTYDFTERKDDKATLALKWEELAAPIEITVPNATDYYLAEIGNELRSSPGFSYQNWTQAAQYAIQQKRPAEALQWAEAAAHAPQGIGHETFQTLMTLATAQELNGKTADAAATREKALNHPTATASDVHQYGRLLLTQKKKDDAIRVWEFNAKRFGKEWPTNVSLARANSAKGNYAEALKYAKLALAEAPDAANKKSLEGAVKKLEAGQDIN
jgi:tetratricopeptide (TPR) repeat protein